MATANEKLRDALIRGMLGEIRTSRRYEREVLKSLDAILDDVTKLITRAKVHGRTDTVTYERLDRVRKDLAALINKGYAGIRRQLKSSLDVLDTSTQRRTADDLNRSVGVGIAHPVLSKELLDAHILARKYNLFQGSPLKDWISKQSADFLGRISQVVTTGVILGHPTPKIARSLRGVNVGSVLKPTQNQLRTLVRTAVHTVANEARAAVFENNRDILKGYQWLSTLDTRTSPICMARSGAQYTVDKDPVGDAPPFTRPPAHYNCRSTLMPITKSWAELDKPNALKPGRGARRISKIPTVRPSTQASMSGQVPAHLNYGDWLKTQSETVQKQVLGKKWTAWRGGKLELRELA